MHYKILTADGAARRGVIQTSRGIINTPSFMPVGTHGTVKAMSPDELKTLGAEIILGNTYHLYLRPGMDVISRSGARHYELGLTDTDRQRRLSGIQSVGLQKDREEWRAFQIHIDGSLHFICPLGFEDSVHSRF
jgi:queuine tRNA-ribosyltransferase